MMGVRRLKLPDSKPRKGLIEVKFTAPFDPFDVNAGDIRFVSRSVATKLHDVWKVIEEPVIPEPKAEATAESSKKKSVITVRVKDKTLMKKFGLGWYPNSEHLIDITIAEPYIRDNVLEVVSDGGESILHPPTPEDAYVPTQPKPWEHATPKMQYHDPRKGLSWYVSHPSWNNQPFFVAINCIMLAYQCSVEDANDALSEWNKNNEITVSGGLVSWQ